MCSIFHVPESICPVPPIPEKAVITECGTKLGDTCHFDCIHGYEMEQGTKSRTCLANGQWDGIQVKCSGNGPLMCNIIRNYCTRQSKI